MVESPSLISRLNSGIRGILQDSISRRCIVGRMAGRLDFTRFFPGLGAYVGPGWAGAWQGEPGG